MVRFFLMTHCWDLRVPNYTHLLHIIYDNHLILPKEGGSVVPKKSANSGQERPFMMELNCNLSWDSMVDRELTNLLGTPKTTRQTSSEA